MNSIDRTIRRTQSPTCSRSPNFFEMRAVQLEGQAHLKLSVLVSFSTLPLLELLHLVFHLRRQANVAAH